MNKKVAIIALIVIVCIVIVVLVIANNNNNTTLPFVRDNASNLELSDEERIIDESKTIELSEPNFMDRSGFELIKSNELAGIKYDKVYSQGKEKAQINIDYNGKKVSLFLSKSKLYENYTDEEPTVYLISDIDVTYVLGDDGIKNYYYQKGNMYYQISTLEDLKSNEIEALIAGFDTKIGDNY